ncbi:hypothetical protein GCM10023189_59950 [Nibrella saemangeumensis]|uniref:DUF4136 domain-containing protein n=2 Tax=Nibrella saemangeumensis TaxID=1084526 RepID=A0ABP8NPM4_9BACT
MYFLNDLVLKDLVRDAVSHEMESRGYKQNRQGADLVVNFRVFDQPTTLRGFTGYGTTYWGDMEVRQPEDTASFQVERGTLMVNMLDRNTGEVVWQGFASGLMEGNEFIHGEDKIKQAVHLIFENYPQEAVPVERRVRRNGE